MQWIWITAGLLTLLAAALLTLLLRRMKRSSQPAADRTAGSYSRARIPARLLRMLRRAVRSTGDTQDIAALIASAHPLMEHILQLRTRLHSLPSLPTGDDGEPRLMDLAREAADEGPFTAAALVEALAACTEFRPTPAEVSAFPHYVALAQSQRLALVLRSMLADARIRSASAMLAPKLARSKQPNALLEKANLNSLGLAALVKALREREQHEAMIYVDRRLAVHDLAAEDLALQDTQRQVQLAEEIRRAMTCFDALTRMDWLRCSEEADALHPLLMADPADVYPRMDLRSRMQLRLQVEMFSRRVRLGAAELIRHALLLCEDAEPRALERYVGYWFQDAEGMWALHRSLPTKKGRLYARFSLRREGLRYALLWFFGIATGFGFLHSGEPVFMLPSFALVSGCLIRWLTSKAEEIPRPCMALSQLPDRLRTLVVLPCVLHDPHEAIRMVRRLKTARHAFPAEGVDYLLLGDFAPGMTVVSSSDAAIIKAAASAVASLEDEAHIFYLQRGRTWDGDLHTCCARGGRRGAVSEICRLIAQGECEDVIAFATTEPAQLERKYDYVLALPEDRQVYPGMLQILLKTMTHPLCSRYPTASGWRGFSVLSPQSSVVFEGMGLIRPDAYLEATDGLVAAALDADVLCGELAGHARVPGARLQSAKEGLSWEEQYSAVLKAWRLFPWQLPWVKTPSGVVNNPLRHLGRFHLREGLRHTLLPLGQFTLLLWAILTGNWLLLLLALVVPEVNHLPHSWAEIVRAGCRLSLLPTRMVVNLRAIWDASRHRHAKAPSWPSLEVWAQGIAATLFAALGVAIPIFAAPALALSVLFACFPLAHRALEAPVRPTEGLTNENVALLEDTAASTWKFFSSHISESTCHLPPCSMQFEPAAKGDPTTSPEAIGAYLLACLCAKDLGYISADAAAVRIQKTLDALSTLSMPFGLPCRRYALPSLTVLDARVDAPAAGFLIAALMTAAQALRTWLPELSLQHAGISAQAEQLLSAFDVTALYDEQAGLFHLGLDENGQGAGYVSCFADDALLLVIASCARKQIPPECFDRLSRTCVRLDKADLPLSLHGTASEHLLASLFVPMDEDRAQAFLHAMAAAGQEGLLGQDECGLWGFDPALRYRRAVFGVADAALRPSETAPVYAPYAAALCLPFAPRQAADVLARFYALGAKGPEGFCDAVDLSQGTALIGLHDAFHQGLMLIAAAHLLADTPVRRYFCALPEVEACLPLLEQPKPPLVLPALPRRRHSPALPALQPRIADPLAQPAEAHLLGTSGFRMLVDARGCSAIYDEDIPLTKTDPHGTVQGIQFYLADEGRIYRLGSPLLQGQTIFAAGEVQVEQLCGSLRAEMTCCVDTIRRRTLHVVTITNLSTRDRLIDLADFLLPDLSVPPVTLEADRPAKGHLTLHARETDLSLHHTMDASIPALATGACTDALAFIGRGRTLHQPASLEEPLHDLVVSSAEPCLSFRARFSLGGRGQISVWFTTSLAEADPPLLTELAGLRHLASMQHSAIEQSGALKADQAQIARRLILPVHRAGQRIAIVLSSPDCEDVLTDMIAILGWFLLHSMRVELCIVCPAGLEAQIGDAVQGRIAEDQLVFISTEEFFPLDYPLCLNGDRPLSEQLDALSARLVLPSAQMVRPSPAQMPKKQLIHASSYGGFDPETHDYILQLEPGQTTPAPWCNTHVTRHFQEQTDESGFRAPFGEQVWIQQEDGTLLSPWLPDLPRAVRMRPGETDWEAWSSLLDLRLRAACLPGHRCGLRSLHIHNASDHPMTLRITVLAHLAQGAAQLAYAPGVVMTDMPESRLSAFLAGNDWSARRISARPAAAVTDQPLLDAPDDESGDTALLYCDLSLEPQRSGKVVWVAGFARHGEDVARALAEVQAQSTSALLRAAQTPWTQRLSTLTISTPEDTLDLLMNRILPVQALSAAGAAGVSASAYIAPSQARRTLLQQARQPMTRDEWASYTLLLAAYVRDTGDMGLLNARIFPQDAPLFQSCREALTQLPLDRQSLPLGDDQPRRCFLYALAAQALEQHQPNPELQEFSRKLLNAADTYLWQDGYYGESLRLDVQYLACAAYGANPRTRQAMSACWTALYDPPHGLIRRQEADASAPLPGLPENGGMVTLDAVHCLRALLRTDHNDNAFELLRALNPIHHTDDPLRTETFRCAPYQLHGGMYASPLEAGRAVPDGGAEAAAHLYAVVLRDILGFQREGQTIRLKPNVPPDWEDYALTLREGTSTWHISVERRIKALTIDGDESPGDEFTVTDDGRVHQIRFPLT